MISKKKKCQCAAEVYVLSSNSDISFRFHFVLLQTDEVKSALDRPSSIELANFDIWKECAYLRFG